MTKEQIEKVEKIVNGKIKENLPISWQEMDLEEARLSGAIGLFGHKYETKVKVMISAGQNNYFPKKFAWDLMSLSLGGLGRLKIVKEEAVSAGVRRIRLFWSNFIF